MTLTVRRFEPQDADAWDRFCEGCLQATLLHSRRFLSYHGERFEDFSLIVEEDGGCIGLLGAAVAPSDRSMIVSHPGATYGGIVHRGGLRGERMIDALRSVCRYYAAAGFERLLYKAVPVIYHRAPAQDDLYAVFRLGFDRVRCDLSSTIDLANRLPVSNRRTRAFKKAMKSGVRVEVGPQHIDQLWAVLSGNLRTRYETSPVHSVEEIRMLSERFPAKIRFVSALLSDRVIAGVVLFDSPSASHAQYIASSDEGYATSALDAVFESCIASATDAGKRWFDFGISNEKAGQVLNEGLYEFKSNFGGGGVVHEFYERRFGEEEMT